MEYLPATVTANREYGPGHWVLDLVSDTELPQVSAGQFLMLRCDPIDDHSLLRPFSILAVDASRRLLRVYYKHLGRLSRQLSNVPVGARLSMLFPLGEPFPWQLEWRRVALVGGGVGMAPLLCLAEELKVRDAGVEVVTYFGGNTTEDLVPELLAEYEQSIELATMDGSLGFSGNVVELYSQATAECDVVYTCGPTPMMRALKAVLPDGVAAYASLEERMACGVGACLGCVAKIKVPEGLQHQTVCKVGPVFDLRQVDFD